MRIIEILMAEHRNIERVLDALEVFVSKVESESLTDRATLGQFVEFISEYADHNHHAKEENILFKAMGLIGFPTHAGPVGVMLHEHDLGRQYVGQLTSKVEGEGDWDDGARSTVINAARGFSALLRQHITKEDRILYPMAEGNFSNEVRADVDAQCAQHEDNNAARVVALVELADGLVSRFPPS